MTLLPLRERREDLGLLIAALLCRITDHPLRFAPAALRALLRHDWPHNVRELAQVLTTASALADGDVIDLEHLPARLRGAPEPPPPAPDDLDPEDQALRARLIALFTAHQGSVMGVAEALGKQRAQIYKWIKRFHLDLSAFRNPRDAEPTAPGARRPRS